MDANHIPLENGIHRLLGSDDNPLRRRSDRLQSFARVVVVVLFVAGCVGGILFGRAAYEEQRAVDRLDAKYGYQVAAKILRTVATSSARDGGTTRYTYRVAWRDNQGRQHVDTFSAMSRSPKRNTLTLWVNHRGEASTSHRAHGQTVALGVFKGTTVVIYTALLLVLGYAAFLFALNRRRFADWGDEWDVVEPQWRRQVL